MSAAFTQVGEDEVRALIQAFPLAWLVPAGDPGLAQLLPCLPTAGDETLRIEGHIPLSAPLCTLLENDPRLTILVLGPNGYVSPRMMNDPRWGPTWNFASVSLSGTVDFMPGRTGAIVKRLTAHMEGMNDEEWIARRMGDRFDELAQKIVGFECSIEACRPRFKLGQDEATDNYGRIAAHFGDSPLGRMMNDRGDA